MAKKRPIDDFSAQNWLFDISEFSDSDLTGSSSDLSNAVAGKGFKHPTWKPNCPIWAEFHSPTLNKILNDYPVGQ